MKERILTNGRLAVEKGLLPDEAVCVGQLSGGDGVYIHQSSGQLITNNGQQVYVKDGQANIVVSQQRVHLFLRFINANRLEGQVNFWELDRKFGALIYTSLLVVNSVPYNRAWFNVVHGTDQYGNVNMPIIQWAGSFPLEVTDSIYWSI